MRKIFVRSVPPLQTASRRSFTLSRVTFKRFNVSIFFAKLSTIIYLTNQAMIPESGITRRRQSKNVHRLPFFLSRPPYRAIFLFALYPTWEPVHKLLQCNMARRENSRGRDEGRLILNGDANLYGGIQLHWR